MGSAISALSSNPVWCATQSSPHLDKSLGKQDESVSRDGLKDEEVLQIGESLSCSSRMQNQHSRNKESDRTEDTKGSIGSGPEQMSPLDRLNLSSTAEDEDCDESDVVEADPGPSWSVTVSNVYEHFYPVTSRRVRRPLPKHVIHRRKTVSPRRDVRRDTTSSVNSDSSTASSDSSGSDAGFPRQQSSPSLGPKKNGPTSPSKSETARPKRQRGVRIEVMTRWSELAGKVLHNRVLALTTVSQTMLCRAQYKIAKRGKKVVWISAHKRAADVVKQARLMAQRVAKETEDCYDCNWLQESPHDAILIKLFGADYLDCLMILAKAAMKLMASQPILVEASAPCRVFGDIHGQLRDLLMQLRTFGWPGVREAPDSEGDLVPMSFVFNGDFVDRGSHQLETIGLLLALKVAMPDKVWLVRGNHEERMMNERYGFQEACMRHLGPEFGKKAYDLLELTFEQLPMACLIEGRILVVHGGIGKGDWDLNHLRARKRPLNKSDLYDPANRWLLNILWSDPIADDFEEWEDDCDARSEGPVEVFGTRDSPRNDTAVLFGWNVTKAFCARNGLGLVIRSHQSRCNGLGFGLMHDDKLVRVFSARDYEDNDNDCATLLITHSPSEKSLSSATSAQQTASFSQQSLSTELMTRAPSLSSLPCPPSLSSLPSLGSQLPSCHLVVQPQVLGSLAKHLQAE